MMENERNEAPTTTSPVKRQMTSANFRFLLVSDLHLEQPPALPNDLPEAIRTKLLETAFPRLERIADAAISQRVDAVFIAGDLLHVERSGPRKILFLLEQFERLAAQKIPVYWAGGAVDQPDRWSTVHDLLLPDNVHVFPEKRFQTFWIAKNGSTDGKIIARVVGLSRSPDHDSLPRSIRLESIPPERIETASAEGIATVVLLWGPNAPRTIRHHYQPQLAADAILTSKTSQKPSPTQEPTATKERTSAKEAASTKELGSRESISAKEPSSTQAAAIPVHFWALGGRHLRGMRRLGETVLHYPGTPQGLMPEQVGTHGVSLVELDLTQPDLRKRVRVSLFPTDPVRWICEEIRLEPGVTTTMIEQRLRERLRRLMETAEETSLMVTWKLFAEVTTIRMLRRGYAAELLRILRNDAQQWNTANRGAANFVWNVGVEPILVGTPEKILVPETESMLRDYFAEIREIEKLAFPKGTPHDPLLDDPILPDLHADQENDFDPDNDLAMEQDARNDAKNDARNSADAPKNVTSSILPQPSSKTSNYPYRPRGIAEQFALLDDFVGFSEYGVDSLVVSDDTPADGTIHGDDTDGNADTLDSDHDSGGHGFDHDSDGRGSGDTTITGIRGTRTRATSPSLSDTRSESSQSSPVPPEMSSDTSDMSTISSTNDVFIPGGDPVKWYQWLRHAAAWNETAPAMRNLLREAAMMGVDLLDHEDEWSSGGGKMRRLGDIERQNDEPPSPSQTSSDDDRSHQITSHRITPSDTTRDDITRSQKGNQEDKR